MLNMEIANKLHQCNMKYREISSDIKRMRFKNTLSILPLIEQKYKTRINQFLEEVEKRIEMYKELEPFQNEIQIPIKELKNG